MAAVPALRTGLDAYRAGDWLAASESWRAAAQRLAGHERELALVLAALAAAPVTPEATLREDLAERLSALPDEVAGIDVAALRERLAAREPGPPEIVPARLWLTASSLKFAAFVLLLLAAAAVMRWSPLRQFLDREAVVTALLHLRETRWAPLALVGLYVVSSPLGLPVSPLMLAGGVVFGVGLGSLCNVAGTLLGAAASFLLARLLGRDFVARLAGKRLRRVETLIARRGFWALVGVRFVPLPFPVVNFGAALAGVPLGRFLLSSAVGLVPAVTVYTYLAAALFELARGGDRDQLPRVALAFALVMAIGVGPAVGQQLVRRRRYHRLRAQRRDRSAA